MMASLTTLPFILFAPKAFILYFSLSSLSFIIGILFYQGPCVYLKKNLCEKENLPISLLFIGSTVFNVYS
jgi:hypothetical protein